LSNSEAHRSPRDYLYSASRTTSSNVLKLKEVTMEKI